MKKQIRKQQIRFFVHNMIAFALIFLLLGGIILRLMGRSVYKSINEELLRTASQTENLKREIEQNLTTTPDQKAPLIKAPQMNFQVQVILWSKDNKILNQADLGNRLEDYQNLTPQLENLHSIQELSWYAQDGRKLYFHTVTIPVPKNLENTEIHYIQFVANTNQIHDTLIEFRTILILCLCLFFALSIGVSAYLSYKNMQPIYLAWQKQQDFVENASHELRTPLTIIQNKLETILTQPYKTIMEESENVALSLAETRRLDRLTTDLLLLARSDSNQVTLNYTEVNLSIFLNELISPYQEIAEMEEKSFHLIDQSSDVFLRIDSEKIHQVLVILLDNALKYTSKKNKIELFSKVEFKQWTLKVSDTGKGIAEDHQPFIFERFYREDQARQRTTGGYGLGLAIAKGIVEMHGGTLRMEDNFPSGSIFIIQIPI